MNELINLGNGQYVKITMLKGEKGSDIQSIAKTSTSGLVDTYTITLTDGSTHTFTVTNGSSIQNIEKTGTSGLVDTYTVTLTSGSISTFTVTNGNGIVSIEKTSTQGAVDTYTITLTDGSTSTFTVTNATGAIDSDFSASSTNPLQNDTLTNIIAGVENGATASQTYTKGKLILRGNKIYEVTTAIASGDTITVGVNIAQTSLELQIINKIQYNNAPCNISLSLSGDVLTITTT